MSPSLIRTDAGFSALLFINLETSTRVLKAISLMFSPVYTVVVPFPGCSIQLRQTPDGEYKVHVRIRVDRREDGARSRGSHDIEED